MGNNNNQSVIVGRMSGGKMELIEILRLPLAILIVTIHFPGNPIDATISRGDLLWMMDANLGVIWRVFISCIAYFAVPVFFLISGYLFFFKVDSFDVFVWKKKLNSRLYTLLVPYILWNIIRFIFEIPSNGFKGWQMMFIAPVNGQFWFVRDLIYLSIISPLIWWFCKRLGWLFPLFIYVFYSLDIIDWPIHAGFLTILGLLFFSLGATLSMKKIDMSLVVKHCPYLNITILVIYICYSFIFSFTSKNEFIRTGLLILGIPGFVNIVSLLSERLKIRDILTTFAATSFFIYASHKIIGKCIYGLFKIVGLKSFFGNNFFFVPRIALIVLACMAIYILFDKYSPRIIFKCLTGNRK